MMLAQSIIGLLEENQRQAEWLRAKTAAEAAQADAEQKLDDKLTETEDLIEGYGSLASETGHAWYFNTFDSGSRSVLPLAILPPRPGVPGSNPVAVFELSGAEGPPVLMAAIQTGPHRWSEDYWPATDLQVEGSRSVRQLHRLGENEVLVIDGEGRSGIGYVPVSTGQTSGVLGPNVGGTPSARPQPLDFQTNNLVVLDNAVHLFTLTGETSINRSNVSLDQVTGIEWRSRPIDWLRSFVRSRGQRNTIGDFFGTTNANGRVALDEEPRRFALPPATYSAGVWLAVNSDSATSQILLEKGDDGSLIANPDEPERRPGLPGQVLWFAAAPPHTTFAVAREDNASPNWTQTRQPDNECNLTLLRSDTRLSFRSCFSSAIPGVTVGSGTPVGPALVRGDGFLHLVERKNAGFSIWRISSAGTNERVTPIDIDPFVFGSRIIPVTASLTASGEIALAGRLTDPDEGGSRPVILESIGLPPFSDSSLDWNRTVERLKSAIDFDAPTTAVLQPGQIWANDRFSGRRKVMDALWFHLEMLRGAQIASSEVGRFTRRLETFLTDTEALAARAQAAADETADKQKPLEPASESTEFDPAFVNGLALRIGLVLLALYAVQIMANQMRYAMRMEAFYRSRYDALQIARADGGVTAEELGAIVQAMSSDTMDFGKQPVAPSQQIIDIGKTVIGRGGKP
ncbi:MAG: hypothetical protein ACMVY4_22140 [Minwuia sp.]|uniref:hypothetical protein n=1 Tax=Minwuia sp. TaxID=2493630 RepID=UPI003A83E621